MTNNRLINYLLTKTVETHHLTGYMNRYWLFRPRNRTKLQIRLHNVLRSDKGRDRHNHPWWYLTIILRGGYWEERTCFSSEDIPSSAIVIGSNSYEGWIYKQWRGAGSIIFRKADTFHRLFIPENATTETWTLFITGKKKQSWGFLTRDGFVHHLNYQGEN